MEIRNANAKTIVSHFALAVICIASLAIALPAVNDNIEDPNLIAYFDHDEGFLMDLAWYYYSGEKRDSFQYDTDYGLELRYLTDFSRSALSGFITFTPGSFVLILRWLHLLSWIFAIMVLWGLVRYHFGGVWQPLAAVLLLGTSPAFAYFSKNLKPEPLVLLFMLIGMHYTLRIVDGRTGRYAVIAVACAAIASIIKFAGIFLLPAVVMAMYLNSRYNKGGKRIFPELRFAWTFPGICGLFSLFTVLSIIFLYRRRLTGLTWFEQSGFWQSLAYNKALAYIMAFGALLMVVSAVLFMLKKARRGWKRKFAGFINEINSYAILTFTIFVISCAVFGFRWIMHPDHFIDLVAQTGREAFGYPGDVTALGASSTLLGGIGAKIKEFNPVVFGLFTIYLVVEYVRKRTGRGKERLLFFKRGALFVFLLPFLFYMFFSGGRALRHHMLPFFAAAIILGLQGVSGLSRMRIFEKNHRLKASVLALATVLVATTAVENGRTTVKSFIYNYSKEEDIAFDIAEWWRKNYPPDTKVVADHPIRAYMPSEYANVEFLRFQHDRVGELRRLVDDFKPRMVYYNTGTSGDTMLPAIGEILPGKKARLVGSFDGSGKRYKRFPRSEFVIYELSYEKR